jgi:hypothetical protein
MGKVEVTLLRIAMLELVKHKDVPPRVVINEAIELSRQFGDEKSHGFVNGILDMAARTVEAGGQDGEITPSRSAGQCFHMHKTLEQNGKT